MFMALWYFHCLSYVNSIESNALLTALCVLALESKLTNHAYHRTTKEALQNDQ